MSKITVHRPVSLPDYMGIVQTLQRRAGHALWFRGNSKVDYRLVPSLYRHPKEKTENGLRTLERELMTRFRQRSLPYHARDLRDDWEALFFMQHYSVPTRLLDWTENPLVGLHFALMARRSARNSMSAAVWVLDPFEWNRAALQHLSYKGGPLAPGDEGLKAYVPTAAPLGEHPVALYGAHNSPRIVAQQGAFTIFGRQRTPMEAVAERPPFSGNALECIVINHTRIEPMRKSLLNQGITEPMVFPDLEGLARETKRHFGFEE